jgi:Ni,Fe-hydrogenase III large subunit
MTTASAVRGVFALADLERLSPQAFHDQVVARCEAGSRIGAMLVVGPREPCAVLLDDERGEVSLLAARVPEGEGYPSLTVELPSAQAFERELFEEHALMPEGHPWLKPLRRHAHLEPGGPSDDRHAFFRTDGDGIHEVAVGPVHAGIIEPGHFRFQCRGETVHHLEIELGYQRRGVLPRMVQSPAPHRIAVAESIAGDTAVGHALAYSSAIETLAGVEPPLCAQVLGGVALELERIANHLGDLGALAGDVGYQPGAAWFGKLRGDFLNLLLELSGNRFGRGLIRPGGVRSLPDAATRRAILARLDRASRDVQLVADIMFDAPSVLSRFERTGVVTHDIAEAIGLVGPAARAAGCDRDARRDHPHGVYRFAIIPVAHLLDGDVMARALVRRLEAQRSLTFVRDQISELQDAPPRTAMTGLRPAALSVGVVEGWRGEIVHVVVTDGQGELASYQVVDPSFHNWFGLAMALRGGQISDFPLCNKSFNLSYAGHDL